MALTIPAEGTHTFCLGFCPVGSGHTTYTARLLLSLDQDHQAYLDVRVGGRASDACLLFDRREVSPRALVAVCTYDVHLWQYVHMYVSLLALRSARGLYAYVIVDDV